MRAAGHCRLSRSLSRWRLSVVHVLRHAALQKLRQSAMTHQQSLATLRKSMPRASQRGTAPLAQLARTARLLWLCRALGRWRLLAMAIVEHERPPSAAEGVTIARVRVKRAGAQEIALMELRSECAALRAAATERERALALAQKQLAHETDRRRVVESGGKHAQEMLSRMQMEQGRARARDGALSAAQEGEREWRDEAARAVRERGILGRESGARSELQPPPHGAAAATVHRRPDMPHPLRFAGTRA